MFWYILVAVVGIILATAEFGRNKFTTAFGVILATVGIILTVAVLLITSSTQNSEPNPELQFQSSS